MAKFSSLHSSRFRRYPDEGYIAGVCAGVAEFLGWNVRLIRALAVLTFIFGGFFPIVLVYGLLWYVMEETRGGGATDPRGYDGPGDAGGGSGTYAGSGSYRSSRHREGSGGSRFGSSADLKARFSRLDQRLSSMEECVTSNDYELRRELRKLEH